MPLPTDAFARPLPQRIVTQRLELRWYEPRDAEPLHRAILANLDRLRPLMPWAANEPQDLDYRRRYVQEVGAAAREGRGGVLAMTDARAGAFLGSTGFTSRGEGRAIEVGYWIVAEAEGRGLMTEAVMAQTLVGLGLLGADSLEIRCDARNSRSAAVAERSGYRLAATLGEDDDGMGSPRDTQVWLATPDSLAREPLASFPRPRAFDADGRELEWPA